MLNQIEPKGSNFKKIKHKFSSGVGRPQGWKNWCLGSTKWKKLQDIWNDEQLESTFAVKQQH